MYTAQLLYWYIPVSFIHTKTNKAKAAVTLHKNKKITNQALTIPTLNLTQTLTLMLILTQTQNLTQTLTII